MRAIHVFGFVFFASQIVGRPPVSAPATGAAREVSDTVTLTPGDSKVDGRVYKPNLARVVTSTTKGGTVIQSNEYTNDLIRRRRGERDEFELRSQGVTGATDPAYFASYVMDARTLELSHVESRDGHGRQLMADMTNGTRVSGSTRRSASDTALSLAGDLAMRAYLVSFIDAAIGATTLVRPGRVFHVPAYVLSGGSPLVEWHNYTVIARDTIDVLGERTAAWHLEEGARPTFLKREFWIMERAPYLPMVRTTLSDGRVLLYQSTLIREHA